MAKEEAQAQRRLFGDTPGASPASDVFDVIDIDPNDSYDSARSSTPSRRLRMTRGIKLFRRSNVALVTTASYSPTQNRKKREKQYMWIQGVRLPFLILSMSTYVWLENIWISALLFLISVPLPWIAVVIANGIGEPRDPRAPAVYKPALARQHAETTDRTNTTPIKNSSSVSELLMGDTPTNNIDSG